MKKNLSTILLILVFLVGLSVLLYPTVSDWWNARVQTQAVLQYSDAVAQLPQQDYSDWFAQADEFNARLSTQTTRFLPTDTQRAQYNSILNVKNGMMGYIQIEKIGVTLPIYHGTSEQVLQVAVGHIEGTSLPVGGTGTHCALSGHRGLPSARLFTDLDKLTQGDTFVITVLDRVLTYEIDQILIVEPADLSALAIDPEQDYCTLVTCTPYGINSHRMLLRGHRVENAAQEHQVNVKADAVQLDRLLVASVLGALLLVALMIFVLLRTRKAKKKGRDST